MFVLFILPDRSETPGIYSIVPKCFFVIAFIASKTLGALILKGLIIG